MCVFTLLRTASDILQLNKARIHALEDLHKIVSEKETVQAEINSLEVKLAEADARIRAASQEKVQVEILENQLEKFRNELINRSGFERSEVELPENKIAGLNEQALMARDGYFHSLSKEIGSLRTENLALKHDIQTIKSMISSVRNMDERLVMLEKGRSFLESSLKELESKLSASQEEVSKLSALEVESKDLWSKVENLELLLDKATTQADQAISVLQQTQELRKKVDKLEGSLKEAEVYKLSSDKLHEYNELMLQKIKLLEMRLQISDDQIHSYVELYQKAVNEFKETLDSLKEESKKRSLGAPVDDLPSEFWSHLLLTVDGWLLEKKISSHDAELLREMIWKRDHHVCDVYVECKQKKEGDAISSFLKLISSPKRYLVYGNLY